MIKKRSPVFFRKKIGVTPPVAAPGDTNYSDASDHYNVMQCSLMFVCL